MLAVNANQLGAWSPGDGHGSDVSCGCKQNMLRTNSVEGCCEEPNDFLKRCFCNMFE